MNAITAIDAERRARGRMSRYAKPLYSKKQVNRAGDFLAQPIDKQLDMAWEDWEYWLQVINNFRAVHAHPLNTFQTTLRIKGRQIDPDIIVAQRVKRLSSIRAKLVRFPLMTLSQMQDIGGCRGIVTSAEGVDELAASYLSSNLKHKLHTDDDYVRHPKATGYRGRHLIYRYYSDKVDTYNGLKIEMQLRSQFQHAWATAVEIVGTFTRQALKSSQGEEDWLRFFALMGSAIARIEGTPLVPGTPTNDDDLILELKDAEHNLDAMRRLRAFSTAPMEIETVGLGRKNHFFLLELNLKTNELNIKGYPANQLDQASVQYLDAEKRLGTDVSADAVLVSVESLAALRKAYPNYYLDTDLFVELVDDAMAGAFIQ